MLVAWCAGVSPSSAQSEPAQPLVKGIACPENDRRIYRIVYRDGSAAGSGAAKFTPCASASAPAGNVSAGDANPPEGTHPDAGAADDTAGLPVAAGATKAMLALGDRIYHGQVGGATCTGCHGAIAKTITTGVPQPKQYRSPMPPMGGAQLSSDQVSAVAAYIWGLSHR
jgi:mono/diheme cytochrome c family protein